ncbi:uncharacterized protein MYCFIDRAFT_176284 [Pseudocercospora fijiensis CIRAD86]|uniref:Uncharacterized protein n=1 Tax=Pseudocercospora fijiensis (strain CIRAD86) TaxID=383855 RepID=M3AUV0_PSEFD|nr:uncharacterized protein MYCFIDRAFT_176284 [Pseudocercospora fijiensis CIRAD86]EME80928.1 hypothetical protein MYCFIDRAFT_176284 [Pseudocercospora fijiensis CIRAD86]
MYPKSPFPSRGLLLSSVRPQVSGVNSICNAVAGQDVSGDKSSCNPNPEVDTMGCLVGRFKRVADDRGYLPSGLLAHEILGFEQLELRTCLQIRALSSLVQRSRYTVNCWSDHERCQVEGSASALTFWAAVQGRSTVIFVEVRPQRTEKN